MSTSLKVTKNLQNELHLVRLELTEESIKEFQLVLQRALNCWPDAPADFKSLADILEYGRPLQDYNSQPT